jgi:hypothetical protein
MKEPDERSRPCFLKATSMVGLAVAFNSAVIVEAATKIQEGRPTS